MEKLKIVLVVVAALFISILIHEMGHYCAFRYDGLEVEKVNVGAAWKFKATVFTDSSGTKYEIGPLLAFGYTEPKEPLMSDMSLADGAKILFSGVAANTLAIMLLTVWYFWLKKRQKALVDFTATFTGKVFRIFIFVNFLMLITNTLIPLPFIDGGLFFQLVLIQHFAQTTALYASIGLGVISVIWINWKGCVSIFTRIDKAYGW